MKKIVPLFLLSAGLALFMISCKKHSSTGLFTYSLLKGQCVASANGNNFTICFDSIITDSRCPTGAYCFWPGYVAARFSFHQMGMVISFPLAIGTLPTYSQDTIINQIKISLKDVTPYPSILSPPTVPIQAVIEVTE